MVKHRISDDDRRRIVCIRLPALLVRQVDSLVQAGERSRLMERLLREYVEQRGYPAPFNVKGNGK